MPPTSDATDNHGNSTSKRRRYRDLRERTERQQRRREEFIERLAEQQRERRLRSFQRPSAADTESIEGPAPAEDSSVPPDPAPRV
jgi:nucleosome binding factor SPN SPT16 subunit